MAQKGYGFDVRLIPQHELHVLLADEEAVKAGLKWYLALPDDIEYGNYTEDEEECGWSEDADED
jgi:hypothetical protein